MMYGVIKNAKSIESWITVVWFCFEHLSQRWQAKIATSERASSVYKILISKKP